MAGFLPFLTDRSCTNSLLRKYQFTELPELLNAIGGGRSVVERQTPDVFVFFFSMFFLSHTIHGTVIFTDILFLLGYL